MNTQSDVNHGNRLIGLDSGEGISGHPLSPNEVVYTPNGVRRNNQSSWSTMFADLINSRELLWRLVLRDVSARHRQSLLGWIWVIIPPVLAVAILNVLIENRSLSVATTTLPYPVHVLWSLSLWQLFAGCLTAATNSLINAGSLVPKTNFSKETLVIASTGYAVLDFLIRLFVIVVGLLWYGVALRWQLVFLPVVLISTILLALGIGLMLSIGNLILRDVANALGLILTFGMILTPVFYPPPTTWPLELINTLNPFSPLLIASQDLIAVGSLTRPGSFLFACALSVLVFFAGWHTFRSLLPRVAHHT